MPQPKNALAPNAEPPVNMLDAPSRSFFDPRTYAQMFMDPFDVSTVAYKEANARYDKKGMVGGKNDAFRHLVGTALLAQRRGEPYAKFITNLHETEILPGGYGARGHSKEQVDMDLYNNQIGLEIARKAKDYNDLIRLASEYVNTNKTRTLVPR
jgi:hypothetical protein